jgi:putative nucleotidyltransferase with HDIG domain
MYRRYGLSFDALSPSGSPRFTPEAKLDMLTAALSYDEETREHVHRVRGYAVGLARALGVRDVRLIGAIDEAALLHDIGKAKIPTAVLNKPGPLTNDEFELMKRHVDLGAEMVARLPLSDAVVPIVRSHHENWDGTGYLRGLQGHAIPLGARIVSVVDCFDALTSNRPYRSRMPPADAMRIVQSRGGTMYDPTVVEAFVHVLDREQ